MSIAVVPAREAGWSSVETVFLAEATSRDCWCQFHVLDNAGWRTTTRDSRRALLEEQVATLDPPRGLIALEDGEPVGWCGVEPRLRLAHLLASRIVATSSPDPLGDAGVWSIYCILVPPKRRRAGVGTALLRAAVAHAASRGAASLEGYPIDAAARGGRLPPGFSTGTLTMFEREGFAPVAVLPSARTLVHRRVDA